ncbi:pyridoxamine 5'-phosphate oxidase family protein [Alkalihalobacillus trypoxylicola]|nr:pyridoxamine 5'-phosphate oxidase family protein [Alkalihalobacillus trypoxylicola]
MMRYHRGEIEVQEKSSVREEAKKVSKIIRNHIVEVAAKFIEQQVMLIIGLKNKEGFVWSSIVYGNPGFVKVNDEQTLSIFSLPDSTDPVFNGLTIGNTIGILAIEFSARKRMRVNGVITQVNNKGFQIKTTEVYSNCPKFIQSRTFLGFRKIKDLEGKFFTKLNQEQLEKVLQSDTFFIATHHSENGADASHRGGQPGFVRIIDSNTLKIKDYPGNNMFNTLGNLVENHQSGLLFVDFEDGNFLQMNGESTIDWIDNEKSITFRIKQIRSVKGGFPLRWSFNQYSPFNPPI